MVNPLLLLRLLLPVLLSLLHPRGRTFCYGWPPAEVPPDEVFNMGVILDLSSIQGRMGLVTTELAFSEFYLRHGGSSSARVVLHVGDSRGDPALAGVSAADLIVSEDVQLIIALQGNIDASIARIASQAEVPVLSFFSTGPPLLAAQYPFYVGVTSSEEYQARAIRDLITAFGHKGAVFIYEDLPAFASLAHCIGEISSPRSLSQFPIHSSSSDDDISKFILSLCDSGATTFVVHSSVNLGIRLLKAARKTGLMVDGNVWLVTDMTAYSVHSAVDPSILDQMQGIIGLHPYVAPSKGAHEFEQRWRLYFSRRNKDYYIIHPTTFDLLAYDLVSSMMVAVVQASKSGNRSMDAERLLDSILRMEFDGVSGKFYIKGNGLMLDYEMVEVMGDEMRKVGLWSEEKGIEWRRSLVDSLSRASGRTLRIAVPGKLDPGFSSILSVGSYCEAGQVEVRGFVIDVFEAAATELPYTLEYEYVPYPVPTDGLFTQNDCDGLFIRNGYDDLMHEVYLKNYDAVVGDVTILGNRTMYVDFTLPYTESGVSMIVPVKNHRNDILIFLKPFTSQLWLAMLGLYLFIGFAVFMIEHQKNRQCDTSFISLISVYCMPIFCMQMEKLKSSLSRFLAILWCFMTLILTSAYTASLTSMLTVQHLQPAIDNLQELIKKGDTVGYRDGTFVKAFLLKLGFSKSQLRSFRSPQQYAEALSSGSKNGGVAAIFDEVPYLKAFLSDHCGNSAVFELRSTVKTGGFGFAFPKGSPLVADLSRAIINLIEQGRLEEIERKWFKDKSVCLSERKLNSSSINYNSFSSLFLVTVAVSIFLLGLSSLCRLYMQKSSISKR